MVGTLIVQAKHRPCDGKNRYVCKHRHAVAHRVELGAVSVRPRQLREDGEMRDLNGRPAALKHDYADAEEDDHSPIRQHAALHNEDHRERQCDENAAHDVPVALCAVAICQQPDNRGEAGVHKLAKHHERTGLLLHQHDVFEEKQKVREPHRGREVVVNVTQSIAQLREETQSRFTFAAVVLRFVDFLACCRHFLLDECSRRKSERFVRRISNIFSRV